MVTQSNWLTRAAPLALFGFVLLLGGCADQPLQRERVAPLPSVEINFQPAKGQSLAQQDRDRYACYVWARDKTGFDPSLPALAPSHRVHVESTSRPGQKTAAGAFIGAVLGAASSEPGEGREGAIQGAIAGAFIGASADAADEQERQRQEERQARIDARLTQQVNEYRRAMTACLEGRGYTVK